MKTILVPTDFSPVSETAMNYAISLVHRTKAKIILFHAYQVPVPVAEVPFTVLNEEQRLLKEDAERQLQIMARKIDHAGGVNYEKVLEQGDAVTMILKTAKEKNVDLIVMGATGQTGLIGAIFGSTSLKVMEKATSPVMAIPHNLVVSKSIRRITFATDYHRSDVADLRVAAEIAAATGAQLNVLHVSDSSIGADEEKVLMNDFMQRVKSLVPYNNLSFEIIHGFNVEERLLQYVQDESTDMLMMATHYRTFFDRLFNRSITKEIAKQVNIPVVAFHYNAKTGVILF